MAYSDFTLTSINEKFGIKNQEKRLFEIIEFISPSPKLQSDLEDASHAKLKSEKAKSEWLVVPILKELKNRNLDFIAIYSGESLNADKKSGLIGEVDFMLGKETGSYEIDFPLFQMVEAKKSDIDEGIRQCAAQMIGARLFNQKKGVELKKIYGCSTNGLTWKFLCLENNQILIDTKFYYLEKIEELLGAFQYIIDYYKRELN